MQPETAAPPTEDVPASGLQTDPKYAAMQPEALRTLLTNLKAEWEQKATSQVPAPGPEPITEILEQVSQRSPRERAPEHINKFVQEWGECAQHGQYRLNVQDQDGIERWAPNICPTCIAQARARQLMRRAEIAPRFDHASFDNYQATTQRQAHNLAVCRRYAETWPDHYQAGTCLILHGGVGTGKNHLAVAISRAVIAASHTVLHATASEIIDRIRDTWASRRPAGAAIETTRQVLDQFAAIDLLVIDEIGRTFGSKGEQDALFQLINARYLACRPTLVISNLDLTGMRRYLGEASFDRLREGGGKCLTFDWPSYRATKNRPEGNP